MKALHILARLDRGGVETWLKDVCLNLEGTPLKIDFMLMKGGKGAYDDVIAASGAQLYSLPLQRKNIFSFVWKFYRLIKTQHYDAVHSHVHHFSGFLLFIAWLAGARCRVNHSHTDSRIRNAKAGRLKRMYIKVSHLFSDLFSTKKVAVSPEAGIALFGSKKFTILKLGIDLSRFGQANPAFRRQILQELHIPDNALIIGHVGRFMEVKNHRFLINVFSEILGENNNAWLLLIGAGDLQNDTARQCFELGIADRVKFLGLRGDVPDFLRNVFNVVAMPSLFEGSPVILLESQAAGVPCVVSDGISAVDRPIPELFTTLSLNNRKEWIRSLQEVTPANDAVKAACYLRMVNSDYSIASSVNALIQLYAAK
ncbi:glycosyltransferase [Chitinophaga solisilvae]|uniref:glycosyltransferase n=1 Tax=Chitinophaga solisilvae TaxID=1233460 RepID=UPI00136D32E8|nr:glycosyltransferase [Chitinophaga solisilvae]